jgi:hypothetical protein
MAMMETNLASSWVPVWSSQSSKLGRTERSAGPDGMLLGSKLMEQDRRYQI